MLSNPTSPSKDSDEGTVVQVDAIRMLCKVKTLRGQMLPSVRWILPYGGSNRSGDRFTPHMGDRVLLEHGLGAPVIVGFFPRTQGLDGATPLAIASGDTAIDTGSYTQDGTYAIPDQNKPKDMVQGDRLISSVGGALLGLLRGGSVLIRSSRLSEIFLSKFSGLVRIVSRNWEHFTDVSSDVVRNFHGRIYRYVGYAKDFSRAKNEAYNLNFYYGDVRAAETVKTNYHNASATTATDSYIYKEQVLDDSGGESMRRTLEINGNEEVIIKSGAQFTRINTTGTGLKLSYNDQHTIEVNGPHINLKRADGAIINMDSAGIQTSFQGGSVVITTDSITTTKSSSTVTVTNDQVALDSGGHYCYVNTSGVQLG